MAEDAKRPAIRFTGFTGTWGQCKLGDIGSTYTGLSGKNKSNFGHGEGRYVTYMNVFTNTVSNLKMVESVEIDAKQNVVKAGDVFFTTSSETPEEVGMSSVLLENTPNTYLNSFCFGYRPAGKFDNYYLAYMLRSDSVRANIIFLAQGISRYNISKRKVMEIEVAFPQIAEQRMLGDYFHNLDNLITLHQHKLDKLLTVKKSMLEKMFPKNGENIPEIRLAGFTDAWELRKLVDEAELFSGLTYSPNNVVKENGTLVLRSSNVKKGEIVLTDNVYVDPNIVNSCNVNDGDVIVVVRNGSRSLIGKHAQIKGDMNNTVIGAFMTGIRTEHPAFINALLNTQAFDREVEKNLGATINQITNGTFQQMKFMFPKSEEQNRIGDMFTHLDNLITLHQRRLEKIKNIKKSCLEKMFV